MLVEVVCMATRSGEAPAVVGELVCITRGAPKPDISSSERKAGVSAGAAGRLGTFLPHCWLSCPLVVGFLRAGLA